MDNSSYIIAKLENNRFIMDFSCEFLDVAIQSTLKIDTGAELSMLPLRTVYFDILAGVTASGVEDFYTNLESSVLDRKTNRVKIKTAGRTVKNENEDIYVYLNEITNFTLGGMVISPVLFYGISSQTKGEVLLGMDILSKFDLHTGRSRIDSPDGYIHRGDYIFLGCPYDKINSFYLEALLGHLGYLPDEKLLKLLLLNNKVTKASDFVIQNYPLIAGGS